MKCSYCDQKYDPLKARTAFCNHYNCPETVWKNGFEKKAICFKCAKILQDLLFEDMVLDVKYLVKNQQEIGNKRDRKRP